mmetsp:Transcript_781/g.4854  ORF Transcript_781/g.4854 Transcript_781/m.4854 type:complete len:293 (-) Transcript_781:3016-3894(-)
MDVAATIEVVRWPRALRGRVADAAVSTSVGTHPCVVLCFDAPPSAWTRRQEKRILVDLELGQSHGAAFSLVDALQRVRAACSSSLDRRGRHVVVLDTFEALQRCAGRLDALRLVRGLQGMSTFRRVLLLVRSDGMEAKQIRWMESMAEHVVELLPPMDERHADAAVRRTKIRHGRVETMPLQDVCVHANALVDVKKDTTSMKNATKARGHSDRVERHGNATAVPMRLGLRDEEREARAKVALPHEHEAVAVRRSNEDFRTWLPPQAGGVVHYMRDSDTDLDTDDDPDDDLDI